MKYVLKLGIIFVIAMKAIAAPGYDTKWSADGNSKFYLKNGDIMIFDIPKQEESVYLKKESFEMNEITCQG